MGAARPTRHLTDHEIAVARFLHEHPSQRKTFRTIAALLRRSERSIRRALASASKRARAKRAETATPCVFMQHPTCNLLIFGTHQHRAQGTITVQVYSESCGEAARAALDEDVERHWFVHDNARLHLALGRELVKKRYNVAQWPLYWPDLNPIETVWATLHRNVSERFPKTLEERKAATTAAWDTISQREIDAHGKCFCKRLRFWIEHAGKQGG